jgi:hypothetical protein
MMGGVLELTGRVVVVAGDDAALAHVSAEAVAGGASVAVVSRSLPEDVAATVRFRSDPRDRAAWDRVAMHVEQHLGPVDGVATDAATEPVVSEVFAADLARRGHGSVVVVRRGAEAAETFRHLLARQRPATSRSADAGADR